MPSLPLSLAALALLLVVSACTPAPPSEPTAGPAEAGVLFASGTSFGMCMGYCVTRLEVTADSVRFEERGNRDDPPPRVRARALTGEERAEVEAALRATNLTSAEEVYGCPDCADGGAEWVEVGGRRVTFEYGAEVRPAQPLARVARMLRASFPTPAE